MLNDLSIISDTDQRQQMLEWLQPIQVHLGFFVL